MKKQTTYPTVNIVIPIVCALITCLVPWWLALTIAIAVTFFYDSIAIVVVAWLVALQKVNPSLLYISYWLGGAVITYILIFFIKERIGK